MSDVKKVVHESGVCPVCGSKELDYDASKFDGNYLCYPWTCRHCSSTGKEWHEVLFKEHTDIKKKDDHIYARLTLTLSFDGFGKTFEESVALAQEEAVEYLQNNMLKLNDFSTETEEIKAEDCNLDQSFIDSLNDDEDDEDDEDYETSV